MYTFESRVRYSETDENGRLTLTGIMNYLQDCSTFQSEDLGLGLEFLAKRDRAWWLSSWQIIVHRYPVLGETIAVSTWPYDFKGFYGYRNFTIRDNMGNYLVKANSVWFLFDTRRGCPVKVSPEDIRGYGNGDEGPLAMDYAPRKLRMAENYTLAGPVTIAKHHIDTNHHVNNAQYVEIAREALPDGMVVKELRAEYKKAAVFGDVIYPRVSRTEDGYLVSLCGKDNTVFANVWMCEERA